MAADDPTAARNGEDTRLRDFAERTERRVRDSADDLRARAQQYYDDGRIRLDEAQTYLVERVKERPIAATLTAVGAGVLIGLLMAGGRRR
ncbi:MULTISPECIES: DUF883 domain-containing protein [unclassified Caulobacter]|uniref:DUF883 domain-containing protein n=1 Tax=unclassified Caulobacter TaxID=2648921 RepID=UPI0013C787D0|nr:MULTISPECIES: DUF883 domain-containing protein [unclassified Caulobacter]MBC6983207.1 DUF883 domain-containing protein [Caulobacter sp. 17J80-11]NEX92828.1 DUF883 domain-containing protein [Caulobacter sp. 17J65-9]